MDTTVDDDGSSSEDENFMMAQATDLFEVTSDEKLREEKVKAYQVEYTERQRWQTQWMDLTHRRIHFSPKICIAYEEAPGQQSRIWNCSFVLSKILCEAFPVDYFHHKKVLELGCGLGLPGLTTALLGATQVTLTDFESAIPSIQHQIDLNDVSNVVAQKFYWGQDSPEELPLTEYDVILCSDLIYGDTASSELLVKTLVQLMAGRRYAQSSEVLFLYEQRLAGDQGRTFFQQLAQHPFVVKEEELCTQSYPFHTRLKFVKIYHV